jgi:biopolymer transport protein ExbD
MHGGGGGGSGSKKKARIEIIPLIDVIMFLLATFVLFTLSMNKSTGPTVDLNEAQTGRDFDPNKVSTISLEVDGKISLDKQQVTWDGLLIELTKINEKENPEVLINFDQNANYGQAMSILNEIRKLPKIKVNIATKVPPPSKKATS